MRKILLALSLFLVTTAGTCSDDPASANGVVGTYVLASIGGDPLPATFEEGTVTAGSIAVTADQKFTYSETHTGGAGSITETVHGTWALSGASITFTPTDAEENDPQTGTISGSTLTISLDDGAGVRIYNKQ